MPLTKKQREYLDNCNHRWNVKTGATGSGKSFVDFTVTIPKRINAAKGEGLLVLLGNTIGTLERNILENNMEQIQIPTGLSDKLKGKTIEKTSFYVNRGNSDENHLVITFTDGTYIGVVIEYDDDYCLAENMPEISLYNADEIGYISGEEFLYETYFKQLIDIGVVEPIDENILKEEILKTKMNDELREYAQYERLNRYLKVYRP